MKRSEHGIISFKRLSQRSMFRIIVTSKRQIDSMYPILSMIFHRVGDIIKVQLGIKLKWTSLMDL